MAVNKPESACPVCSSTEIKLYFNNTNNDLLLCLNCRLIFANDYLQNKWTENISERIPFKSNSENELKAYASYLELYLEKGGGEKKILDIGCGEGKLMKIFSERGYIATGIDINLQTKNIAGKYGEVFIGDLNEFQFDNDSFDIINCTSTFYYFPDPLKKLEQMKNILRSRGLISINGLINMKSLSCYLRRKNVCNHYAHGINCFYTPNTLKDICRKSGLKIVRFNTSGMNYLSKGLADILGRYSQMFLKPLRLGDMMGIILTKQ